MPIEKKNNRIQLIKYAPPPPELPVYGQAPSDGTSFFARTNYVAALETKNFVFGIKRADRKGHMYVIGKSGVGKSKLLELLMRQDIAYGHGLLCIDPHGDGIDTLLSFIPKERAGDVCLVDPLDLDHPVAFNPFRDVPPPFRHQLTQGFIEIVRRQFGRAWTPRLEHVLRFLCLALLDYPDAAMEGLVAMLTDEAYRAAVIAHIREDVVRRFWTNQFPEWATKHDAEAIMPLVNKFTQFFSDPLFRDIFKQKENKVDFEVFLRERKIVLVHLAKGRVGEEAAAFFGSLFVLKLHEAGVRRAALDSRERRDFYCYCDGFEGIAVDTFQRLLSLGKKYGICLTLSHEFLGQLSPEMQAAVLGHTGTIIVFRVSGEDAVRLKSEMAPVFDVKDMTNLGVGQIYVKMAIDGEIYDPFSAEALKVLPPRHASFREEIIRHSRAAFGAAPAGQSAGSGIAEV